MPRSMIVLVIVIASLIGSSTAGPPRTYAQPPDPSNAFAQALAFVPDAPGYSEWLTFGDIAAWYTAWGMPRPLNLLTLDILPEQPRALWLFILPRQTALPSALGMDTLFMDDQRPFYGFDFFHVDRALGAGSPPNDITLIEHNADPEAIAAQLVASGYSAETLDGGWTLYSILDDYEIAFQSDSDVEFPRVGALGQRNRIALNGQQLITARATAPVTAAIAAHARDMPALVDNPVYSALAAALSDPLLDGTGALVGVIMQSGLEYQHAPETMLVGPSMTPEQLAEMGEELGLDDPARLLPPFSAVAFATSHADDASYLTLALAFMPGADTDRALAVLESKMPAYETISTQMSLADHWSLDRSGIAEVNGIPVVLVTMRVANPPPKAADEAAYRPQVLSWGDLVMRRDLLFLAIASE